MAVSPTTVRVPSQWLLGPSVTLVVAPSDEDCVSIHPLKWGPLPSNDVGRIIEHFRKGEGRKKDETGFWDGITLPFLVNRCKNKQTKEVIRGC